MTNTKAHKLTHNTHSFVLKQFLWLHTLSRLSTSALKPDNIGISMTAMLDEPEWSHLKAKQLLYNVRALSQN